MRKSWELIGPGVLHKQWENSSLSFGETFCYFNSSCFPGWVRLERLTRKVSILFWLFMLLWCLIKKSGSATSSFFLSRNKQKFLPTNARLKRRESKNFRTRRWYSHLGTANVIYGVLLLYKIQDKYAYNTQSARQDERKRNKISF